MYSGVNLGVLAKFPIRPSYHHGHLIIPSFIHPISPVTIPQVVVVNENVFLVHLPGKIRVHLYIFASISQHNRCFYLSQSSISLMHTAVAQYISEKTTTLFIVTIIIANLSKVKVAKTRLPIIHPNFALQHHGEQYR